MHIIYLDRKTGQKKTELIYKNQLLSLVYGKKWYNRLLKKWFLPLLTHFPFFSNFYAKRQKHPSSIKKIQSFIKQFEIDETEFADTISSYRSFNDFFIRRLKLEARPIDRDPTRAIIPADGRYYFYENIQTCEGFIVKGQKFELKELLGNQDLAEEYGEASMLIARLCPSDYHRFHFPCDCIAGQTQLLNGPLYSVNPLAVSQNIRIMSQNKRTLCRLQTQEFGQILYLEIGATCVGSIQQTYEVNRFQKKGSEKGYFEFGGSSLILLFPKEKIQFEADLLEATKQNLEIRCLLGQKMGRCHPNTASSVVRMNNK